MTAGAVFKVAAVAAAGVAALVYVGRQATRRELDTDPQFAEAVLADMSLLDQLKAGARALAHRSPFGYAGTVTVTG